MIIIKFTINTIIISMLMLIKQKKTNYFTKGSFKMVPKLKLASLA